MPSVVLAKDNRQGDPIKASKNFFVWYPNFFSTNLTYKMWNRSYKKRQNKLGVGGVLELMEIKLTSVSLAWAEPGNKVVLCILFCPAYTSYIQILFMSSYSYLYRVSHNSVSTFVFWISQLPRGLEIPSLTFFNSPFHVDSKNVHFVIIWWNLDQDIAKILQGSYFDSQHFFLLLNQELKH